MFRSLHMKLVLIMVLLIASLMTVVGAFLMNSVVNFYMEDFYTQMADMFSDSHEDFVRDLTTPTSPDEEPVPALQNVLRAYMGELGVDGRTRNYYVLDAKTGRYLAGSTDALPTQTGPNLLTAIEQQTTASKSDVTAPVMDVAVYLNRGESSFIVYVHDSRQTVQDLNSALFILIIQALIFGLLISVLLSFLLAKTMITPIERLTIGAKKVAARDFADIIEVESKDEIGVLTDTFNSMAWQLQTTIREAENEKNKLDTLFLRMSDGVVAFSRGGQVIQKNPAAEELLGRQIDEQVTYEELFDDIATLQEVLTVDAAGYLGGERREKERSLEFLVAPFDRDSEDGGVMVVIHDITQQRKTEEMRREFVANVSHELRTPLTNIRSYAETLADGGRSVPETVANNFLQVILNESDRMTHIVQDLLTLSRLDSKQAGLVMAPFSMEKAIQDVYHAVLMEARRRGHQLKVELSAELPMVRGDRARLVQVMMNVVANAIKYTPNDGEITVSAGVNGTSVWVEVADNGMGIPEADRSRIFERFYRVDKARSRESGGTGLGLSIAKEIVEQHEGTMGLVDREGPGLTVRVTLPIEGPNDEE